MTPKSYGFRFLFWRVKVSRDKINFNVTPKVENLQRLVPCQGLLGDYRKANLQH